MYNFFNREKYQTVEEETAEGTKKAKKQFNTIKKKVAETMEEAHKAEILQKACKKTLLSLWRLTINNPAWANN